MTAQFQLVIDCADPEPLARFWVAALGYEFEPPPDGYDNWDDYWRAVGVSEDVNGAAASRINSRLIGDEANAFTTQWREVLFFENVNAGLRVVRGLWRRGRRCRAVSFAEREAAYSDDASQDEQNRNETDTKHCEGGLVVRHATVCYIQPRDASVNMEGSEWVRCVNSDFPRCSCSF